MTLLNILCQQDRVHIVTDGAATNESTVITGFCAKTIVYPHLRAAIGIRGSFPVGQIVLAGIGFAESFDALRWDLPTIVRSQLNLMSGNVASFGGDSALNLDFGLVGWSAEDGRPAGCFMSTIKGRSGTQPFKVIQVDSLITPSNDELYSELGPGLFSQNFIAEEHMAKLANHQRYRAIEEYGPHRIPTSWVGGFVQLTTVTEHDITTKIIHRWPDEVGKTILEGLG